MNSFPSSLFRPVVVLPGAALFLLAAVAMIWYASNIDAARGRRSEHMRAPPPVTVLVSRSGIARGQVLTAGSAFSRRLPSGDVPAGALRDGATLEGHVALAPVAAGAVILASQISRDALAGISVRVPPGFRAYAVAVSEADIAGGFLQVGDRVDLYVTLPGALFASASGAGGRPEDKSRSTLLLQHVAVLAVGTKLKTAGEAETSARTVTLALRPDALARLALAVRLGRVSLAIRNPVDDAPIAAASADIDALFAQSARTAVAAPRPAVGPAGIAVYAGRNRNMVPVP